MPIAPGRNALLRRFVPGAAADETLLWYEGSGLASKSWIAADARGSVMAVMNASGAATATSKYDSYGAPAPRQKRAAGRAGSRKIAAQAPG